MKNIKYITLALFLLFVYIAKASADTHWVQLQSIGGLGWGYLFSYPYPLVKHDGTAEGLYGATQVLMSANCDTAIQSNRPGSCGVEVRGGTSSVAYCFYYSQCTASFDNAIGNFDYHTCADGEYPVTHATGITCQSTEPKYCPDGKIYNNVAGTCDLPPTPPIPSIPSEKNYGSCPVGPSLYVSK